MAIVNAAFHRIQYGHASDVEHILSFAAIDAQASFVIYFLHNGCVLPRVAFAAAKADNTASQTKGEKS
ncbi:hypothetical protein FJ941_25395 [Mesorhizobium sp. B2-3-13]|uniref:hypothetical protein n=1 Tax=Mesorhizobium sp. B2-3-13 TaxID=2589951 RepID=UPI00112C46D5|nr:hypothetical protein [Mesorhizobium sp. B2-3-13]TPL76216.1 hypothetical protein FJ941_25395 [Mesorhizobium sp. B2-3-13]